MPVTARVLVVASGEDYREIGAQLGSHGYASQVVQDFDEARSLGRECRPDIAIVTRPPAADDADGIFGKTADEAPIPVLYISDAEARNEVEREDGLTEFLSPDYSEIELLTRLRALTRLATMRDELNRRAETTRSYGVQCPSAMPPPGMISDARVVVIAEDDINVSGLLSTLGRKAALALVPERHEALRRLERGSFDAVLAYTTADPGAWLY